jgi:hypothetical protein
MESPRVTFVKKTGQFFPLGFLAFHSRLEQGFLDVARHVTPNVHSGPPQQVREAFLSIRH